MNTQMRRFLISSLLISLATTAIAEESSSVEEVEVLGNRTTQDTLIDVNLETYNGFENIINRAEFEHRLVDVSDIINSSVSAQIRKSGGLGSTSSFSIRGSSGKQVNLFLDGMLLTSPRTGSSNISIIPSSIIEQIEIYPDFTPSEFGDANLGGAINIHTRIPEQGFGGKALIGYGSFNSRRLGLDFWGGNDKTEAIVAMDYTASDNDFKIGKKHCEKAFVTCGNSKKREMAGYEQYSALSKVRHHFNEQYSLQVLLGSAQGNNEIPVPNNRRSHKAKLDSELHQFNIMLQSDGDTVRWGTRLYGNEQKEKYKKQTIGNSGATTIDALTLQKQDSIGLNLFSDIEFWRNTLGLALDYSHTKNNTQDKRNQLDLDATREKLALILSDKLQIIDMLSFNASYRSTLYKDKTDTDKSTSINKANCQSGDKDCAKFEKTMNSWQVGFALTPNDDWVIKANYGVMNRMPTLTERFGQTGTFIGNANLKHEESTNIDFGVLYKRDWLELNAAVFNKDLKNSIVTLYDARTGIGKPFNVAKANIKGLEALARFHIGHLVSFHLGGQWLDSKKNSELRFEDGNQMPGIYHRTYQAGIAIHNDTHSAQLNYYYDDEMYFDRGNNLKAPHRELLNASYTWTIGPFAWNLSANNILNKEYFDFNFFPSQGRSFTTTLSYNF